MHDIERIRSMRRSWHGGARASVIGLAVALALAGCAGGDDAIESSAASATEAAGAETVSGDEATTEAAADPEATSTEDGEAPGEPAGSQAAGTVSFDGGEVVLERLDCLQVPAEGNSWRVVGMFDGGSGWVQFDEPSYGYIEFADGDEAWSVEADAPLSVSSEGATGDVVVLLDGTASEPDRPQARLVVDITC